MKERLLEPDLVKEFVREFNAELQRTLASVRAQGAARDRKLAGVDRKIRSMLKAIEDGMYHPAMKERMGELEANRVALLADGSNVAPEVDVLIHPNVPDLYRRKVGELEQLFDTGSERDEAREVIRSMIDRVVLTPHEGEASTPPFMASSRTSSRCAPLLPQAPSLSPL